MIRNFIMAVFLVPAFLLVSCSNEGQEKPVDKTTQNAAQPVAVKSAQQQRSACDFLTKEEVEKITKIPVLKVVSLDRGVFTSCSFETDNWENTTGVIFYPSLDPVANSAVLADVIRKDLERDQAPYKTPEPVEGIADAAAYYTDNDAFMHFMVAQNGRERIIVSAKSLSSVNELVKIALGSK